MKKELIANAFSDIDDAYINESHPAAVLAAKGETSRADGFFRRFMSSPLAAAVLSVIVSVGVLTAVILAGRTGAGDPGPAGAPLGGTADSVLEDVAVTVIPDTLPPGGSGGDVDAKPPADTALDTDQTAYEPLPEFTAGPFAFSYHIAAPDGFKPGCTIRIDTYMTNVSESAVHYSGSSSELDAHIELWYTLPDGTHHRMDEPMDSTDDVMEYTYAPGETVEGFVEVFIPADVPAVTLDLIMSYSANKTWSVTFPKVFTVGDGYVPETGLPVPPVTNERPSAHAMLGNEFVTLGSLYMIHGQLSSDDGDMAATSAVSGEPLTGQDIVELFRSGATFPVHHYSVIDGQSESVDIHDIRIDGHAIDSITRLEVFNTEGERVSGRTSLDGVVSKGTLLDTLLKADYYVALSFMASDFPWVEEGWTVDHGEFTVIFCWLPNESTDVSEITRPSFRVTLTDTATDHVERARTAFTAISFDPAHPYLDVALYGELEDEIHRMLSEDTLLNQPLFRDTSGHLEIRFSNGVYRPVSVTVRGRDMGAVYMSRAVSFTQSAVGVYTIDELRHLPEGLYILILRLAYTEDDGHSFESAFDYPFLYLRRNTVSTAYSATLLYNDQVTTLTDSTTALTDENSALLSGQIDAPLAEDFLIRTSGMNIPTVTLPSGEAIHFKPEPGMTLLYATVYDKATGTPLFSAEVSGKADYLNERLAHYGDIDSFLVILHAAQISDGIPEEDWFLNIPFDYEYPFIIERA